MQVAAVDAWQPESQVVMLKVRQVVGEENDTDSDGHDTEDDGCSWISGPACRPRSSTFVRWSVQRGRAAGGGAQRVEGAGRRARAGEAGTCG